MTITKQSRACRNLVEELQNAFAVAGTLFNNYDMQTFVTIENICLIGIHCHFSSRIKDFILDIQSKLNRKNEKFQDFLSSPDISYTITEIEVDDKPLNSLEAFNRFYESRKTLTHDNENTKIILNYDDLKKYLPFLLQFLKDIDNYFTKYSIK